MVGGVANGKLLELHDAMHHVELPRVDGPSIHDYADDPFGWPGQTLGRDLYSIERCAAVIEHPCVRNAALLRWYWVGRWSKLGREIPPPLDQLARHGVVEHQQQVGTPRVYDAPAWWWLPEPPPVSWVVVT
jgi:hypothetical protein